MLNIKKFLPSRLALTKGVDLWVISDPQHSFWSRLIDWYVGFKFQANRLVTKETPNLKHLQPLLLESSQRLPNLWTLELPYCSQWVLSVYKIWSNLNQPSLRVFIPKPLTKTKFEKQWFQLSKPEALIQYVVEK